MIWNISKKNVISRKPVVAIGFCERGRGMIGRDFSDFDAMVFHGCSAVHTMFMRINIDIIFVDRENRICGIAEAIAPWRMLVRKSGAATVIELPEGTVKRTDTQIGDVLDLNAELSDRKKLFTGGIEAVVGPETAVPFKNGKL